jgi:subtilisin family serine protease
LALSALVVPGIARADDDAGVIVRYRTGTTASERLDTRRDADVTRDASLPLSRSEVVRPAPGQSTADAVRALESDPDVQFAEPNVTRHALLAPTDSLFGQEWALQNTAQAVQSASFNTAPANGGAPAAGADINAPAAWDVTTGDPSVVVGVVDTGVDASRPDLAPNMWTNPHPGSSGVPGVAANDLHGWDFIDNDNDPSDVTAPDTPTVEGNPGHGTHVSGILGAHGNDGSGVAGVSWNTTVMPVRVLDDHGSGGLDQVVDGYAYAARDGARIVNASFGDPQYSQLERDTIASFPNTLFVVAAGNDGANNDARTEDGCKALGATAPNTCSFPCNYTLANVLCVAATDRDDNLASFSNFGATSVDVAAPGTDVLSTLPTTSSVSNTGFGLLSGTSMSTPVVSGVAALILARRPDLTTAQLKQALLDGVDKIPSLDGKVVSGGRIDALKALQAADAVPPPPPPPPPAAPAPPPVVARSATAPRDTLAPVLVLDLARRATIKGLLKSGLRVAAHCSEGCRLTYRVLLDATTAKRLHVRRTAATRKHALKRAATDHADLKLPKALRRARSAKLTVEVRAVDAAGNAVTHRVTVALRR